MLDNTLELARSIRQRKNAEPNRQRTDPIKYRQQSETIFEFVDKDKLVSQLERRLTGVNFKIKNSIVVRLAELPKAIK